MQELQNMKQKYKEQSIHLEQVLAQLTVSFSNSCFIILHFSYINIHEKIKINP